MQLSDEVGTQSAVACDAFPAMEFMQAKYPKLDVRIPQTGTGNSSIGSHALFDRTPKPHRVNDDKLSVPVMAMRVSDAR